MMEKQFEGRGANSYFEVLQMDFLLFTLAEKILANYPKNPLDNPFRQTLSRK